jgi:DNA-directed RNA polymerase II subunit RPB1
MGKRVNFSARTVISPDPNLSIDQVGVPQSIAMNVTYPETVNSLNITRLQKLVHNGPFKYPGTKAVTRNDGVRMEIIRCSERNISLEIGFIVERHLLDEDIVVLNHQPAAFKSSLMAHRVKVWGYSTFALNPSVVGSYDADFDGDEMNMHVPQTLTTQTEAKELMMVSKQMISSISSKPIVGFVQDALLGAYLLTRRDTFLEKEEFMNLLMWVNTWDGKIPQPAVLKPKPLWTGKQVFSLLIPQDISLKTRNSLVSESSSTISDKFSSAENSSVIIDQGNLIVGSLDRRILGSTNNSLVQTILKEKGAESTKQFIDQTQGLLNHWLVQRGFSVSISDLIIDPKTQSQIRKTIDDSIVDYFSLREFESRAIRILAIARDSTGHEVQKCLDDHNNFRSMINAGSKGSLINITQMISCLGQQSISGSRIPLGFQDRALPHYTKFDQCAEARGFVKNSFFIGLRPAEFFFHAMETREGLLEAESNMLANAKIRRILVKNMEDIIVSYDGTVRNSMGQVVQFLYGEDGLDGTFMETQSFPSLKFSNQDMKNNYEFDWNHKGFKNSVSESVYNSLKNASDVQEILKGEIQQLFEDRDFLRFCTDKFRTQMCVPVNIRRLIKKAKKLKLHPINTSVKSDLDPIYVIEQIKKMTEKDLFLVHSHKGDQTFMETNKDATMLFNILLRSTLSSKQVIYHHKLNRQAFDWILQEIRFRFQQSKVHAGEAVGVAAAMSLRELGSPPMIMGFYSGTITHSLPTCRFKELILQFGEFSPWASMEIFPSGNDSHDITNMKSLACQLEYTTLRDLCSLTEIWYDPLIDITKNFRT